MFVSDEVLLDVSRGVARERRAQLTERGMLMITSEDAYGHGNAGLARVGAGGLSKLVRVQVRELTSTDRSAGLAIRWRPLGRTAGYFRSWTPISDSLPLEGKPPC